MSRGLGDVYKRQTHVDDNGCILTAGKMKGYLEHPRILGLGEVMDAPSVINGSVAMHEKLQLFQDRVKDGHAPFLAPGDLAAYVLGGIDTDHECVIMSMQWLRQEMECRY